MFGLISIGDYVAYYQPAVAAALWARAEMVPSPGPGAAGGGEPVVWAMETDHGGAAEIRNWGTLRWEVG